MSCSRDTFAAQRVCTARFAARRAATEIPRQRSERAMDTFKRIARFELLAVLAQFLLANWHLLLPASPACCNDALYPRAAFLSGLLLLTTLAAATILLWVLMAVSSAQAKAAAAYKQGVASVGWNLRAPLLVAIGLAAASTCLVLPTFHSGYGYRNACVCGSDPVAVVAMVMAAFYHAVAALLVAVH